MHQSESIKESATKGMLYKAARSGAKARELIVQSTGVFIGYSRTDFRQAQKLYKRIVRLRRYSEGPTFLDLETFSPGKEVRPEDIDAAIRESNLFILVCGRDTAQSVEVRRELALASELMVKDEMTILPVMLKPKLRLPPGVDFRIQGLLSSQLFPSIQWSKNALIILSLIVALIFAVAGYRFLTAPKASWMLTDLGTTSVEDHALMKPSSHGEIIRVALEKQEQGNWEGGTDEPYEYVVTSIPQTYIDLNPQGRRIGTLIYDHFENKGVIESQGTLEDVPYKEIWEGRLPPARVLKPIENEDLKERIVTVAGKRHQRKASDEFGVVQVFEIDEKQAFAFVEIRERRRGGPPPDGRVSVGAVILTTEDSWETMQSRVSRSMLPSPQVVIPRDIVSIKRGPGDSENLILIANRKSNGDESGHLLISNDFGLTWEGILRKPDLSIYDVLNCPSLPGRFVVSAMAAPIGKNRVEITTDGGVMWTALEEGLNLTPRSPLKLSGFTADGEVLASTESRLIVWRRLTVMERILGVWGISL